MRFHSFLQGDLLDPGIEPGSLALQADSSLSEPPGKILKINNERGYILSDESTSLSYLTSSMYGARSFSVSSVALWH